MSDLADDLFDYDAEITRRADDDDPDHNADCPCPTCEWTRVAEHADSIKEQEIER